jgi:hypothetical protein
MSQGIRLAQVKNGNQYAIDLAFLSRVFLDGGALEDISRGLGSVADNNPKLFLKHAGKYNLSARQMRRILRMMPEETVDSEEKRQRAIRNRIQSLLKVKDPSLIKIRDDAIAVLRNGSPRK